MGFPIAAGAPSQLSSPVGTTGALLIRSRELTAGPLPIGTSQAIVEFDLGTPSDTGQRDSLRVTADAASVGPIAHRTLRLEPADASADVLDVELSAPSPGASVIFESGNLGRGVRVHSSGTTVQFIPFGATNVSVDIQSLGSGVVTFNGQQPLTNPMTTAGDLIIGGAAGAPARLAAGAATFVLTSNGAGVAPSWQAAGGGGGVTWPLANAADETFQPNGIANNALTLHNNAVAVNGVQLTGAAAGADPVLSAVGTDTNIGVKVTPKGTGTTTITAGGLTITAGGLTVSGGGATIVGGASVSGGGVTLSGAFDFQVLAGRGLDTSAAGTLLLGGTNALHVTVAPAMTVTGTLIASSAAQISTADAGALVVAVTGTTNPALQVDTSAVSAATGIKVTAAAAGAGVTLGAISSATNENLNLTSKGTGIVQVNGVAVMTNPMTTAGDLIVGGTAGAATRLARGADTQVLTMSGTSVVWAAAAGGGVTWPLTNAGDEGFRPNGVANNALNLQNAVSAVNGINIQGTASGSNPVLSVVGTDTNRGLSITPKGTGAVVVTANGFGAETELFLTSGGALTTGLTNPSGTSTLMQMPNAATAAFIFAGQLGIGAGLAPLTVQAVTTGGTTVGLGITITQSDAGGAPRIESTGSTVDAPLVIRSKGAGFFELQGGNSGVGVAVHANVAAGSVVLGGLASFLTAGQGALTATGVASGVNGVTVTQAIATATPSVAATGSDTNVSLNLITKGTGTLQLNGTALVGGAAVAMPTAWGSAAVNGTSTQASPRDHSHGTMLDPSAFGGAFTQDGRTTSGNPAWPAASSAVYGRVQGGLAVANFQFNVGTASGNIDIGVYNNTGVGSAAVPSGAKVATKGSTACPAAGYVTVALAGAGTVIEGQHWLALAVDNVTATIGGTSGLSAGCTQGFAIKQTASAFPLPATVGTLATTAYAPALWTS